MEVFPEEKSAVAEGIEDQTTTPVAPETPDTGGEPVVASQTETPDGTAGTEKAWEPSFKYTVKKNDYDMPEWAKGLIKDQATEKELKTLFSKGHGIEEIQTQRQTLREEVAALKSEKESMDQSLNALSSFVQKGDMHSFFEALQIPKDKVLKYAVDLLKYDEMSPEKRAEIDNQRNNSRQLQELQHQNRTLQTQNEQQRVAQKQFELNQHLAQPAIATTVQTFDARNGVGAFAKEVIKQGMVAFHTQGIDITTEQAVNEVLRLIGANNSAADPAAGTPQTQVLNQAPAKKPVIPNVQGRSGSPVRQAPQSLEDLRKLADQMGAANA